jgi:hypothetical protein
VHLPTKLPVRGVPFRDSFENLRRGRAIDKKNPAKIGRELINQGASTNYLSWKFDRNPDSRINFFNRAIA